MGRGSSKIGGGGGGTPSGITYDQFMKMSDDEKIQTMNDILSNPNIQTPNYLDDSDTSKVMYALGMNGKPTVVDDSTFDSLPGREIYRTVYDYPGVMPPPSSEDVADQIRYGDFTQMSGKGGSAHSRAIYYATDFRDSSSYGDGYDNAIVTRSKINPSAVIRSENSLYQQMNADIKFTRGMKNANYDDQLSLYAILKGVDGWYSGTYTMMVNRGNLTMSTKNKAITKTNGKGNSKNLNWRDIAHSWAEAGDA